MHAIGWIRQAIAVTLVVFASASSTIAEAADSKCDITGNWRDIGRPFSAEVISIEPALPDGGKRSFEQQLAGMSSDCDLEIEYLPSLDMAPDHVGDAIEQRFRDFRGLAVDGKPVALNWKQTAKSPFKYAARCRLNRPPEGESLRLTLECRDTRPPRTRLLGAKLAVEGSKFQALAPAEGKGELLVAHGIPFLAGQVSYDRNAWTTPVVNHVGGRTPAAGLAAPYDGNTRLDAADTPVRTIHFLGMIHIEDWGSGSWYTPKGDHGYSHFVGDKAGDILLAWSDGSVTEIPLIFGWNLWYSRPWDLQWGNRAENVQKTIFGGDAAKLRLIPDALALLTESVPAARFPATRGSFSPSISEARR